MTRGDELRKMVAAATPLDMPGLASALSELTAEFSQVRGGAAIAKHLSEAFTACAVRCQDLWVMRNNLATELAAALEREAAKDVEIARLRAALDHIASQALRTEIPEGCTPGATKEWHAGYDAAIFFARAALSDTTP